MRWAKLEAQTVQPEGVLRDHLLTKESELLHPSDILGTRRAVRNSKGMSWILCCVLPRVEQVNKGSSRRFPNPPSAGKLTCQLSSQN